MADLVASLTTPTGRGRPRSTAADLRHRPRHHRAPPEGGLRRAHDGGRRPARRRLHGHPVPALREQGRPRRRGASPPSRTSSRNRATPGSLVGDIRALVLEGCAAFTSEAGGLMKALIGEVQRNPELGEAVRERMVTPPQRPRPPADRAGRRARRDPRAGRSRPGHADDHGAVRLPVPRDRRTGRRRVRRSPLHAGPSAARRRRRRRTGSWTGPVASPSCPASSTLPSRSTAKRSTSSTRTRWTSSRPASPTGW